MADVSDSDSDSVQEAVLDDEELIRKVRTKLESLSNHLRLAHEQGSVIEQRLVRYETLYERATREVMRYAVALLREKSFDFVPTLSDTAF